MLESANYPETKCILDPECMLDCCNLTHFFSSRATGTRPSHSDTMESVAKRTETGYGYLSKESILKSSLTASPRYPEFCRRVHYPGVVHSRQPASEENIDQQTEPGSSVDTETGLAS